MKATSLGVDSLKDVEVFVRIVERGTMTAAGVSLGMSTPLVSRRLAELERCLGVRLVDRSSRMLVLTEHGREFHARAESILQLVREAQVALHSKSTELHGTLRVSLPTPAAEIGIIANFVSLFHRHTDLSIEIHVSDRPVDVIERGFDAALYLTDAPDRHPGDVILGQHPTSLTAAPSYLDRAGRPTSPDELLRHRTVRAVSERGTPTAWVLIDKSGREVVLPPAGAMFLSDQWRVLFSAIVSGAGIGRMPLGYVAKAAKVGQLEVVLPDWRFRPIMIAATLRHRGARSSKVAALMELASTALRAIDAFAVATPLESYYAEQVVLSASPTAGAPPSASASRTPSKRR